MSVPSDIWLTVHTGTPALISDLATGQCLSAGTDPARVRLARCDLGREQRWRPVDLGMAGGQRFAEYSNASTHGCLTTPGRAGLATLAACGKPQIPAQEIAFWWNA